MRRCPESGSSAVSGRNRRSTITGASSSLCRPEGPIHRAIDRHRQSRCHPRASARRDRPSGAGQLPPRLARSACGCRRRLHRDDGEHATIVFDELAARSPVPLLSIVEVCADEARRRGCGASSCSARDSRWRHRSIQPSARGMASPWSSPRPAIVGGSTIGTSGSFSRGSSATRLAWSSPRSSSGSTMSSGSTASFSGTELPLLLPSPEIAGLPALDTTALHVAAIVERLREGAP